MRKVALIPARYAATRFPAKLMQPLGSKTVIRHTYDNTVATGLFDAVYVVTDSQVIFEEITFHGGAALMSRLAHESGTDRIAEAAGTLDADLVVNVQGDTPFVRREPLARLLDVFSDPSVQVASMIQELRDPVLVRDENYVKVALDLKGFSMFFSRSMIPFPRDPQAPVPYYEHIGVYAFRRQALLDFTSWPITPLEAAEKVECLRFLEHGIPLKMVLVDYLGVEIDTPEDLEKAARLL